MDAGIEDELILVADAGVGDRNELLGELCACQRNVVLCSGEGKGEESEGGQ